ncbi:MAG TPA: HEAT repeat domain-containing protein, partial [Tepidisphaeraceae bacterium]|nr:HEAT repeat domain-containing protein [Tepidisphaeraceae bacterium]
GWPKTYQFLAQCEDASVDEALAVAARQLEGPYLRYTVDVLLHRAQPAGLLALIENFHRLSGESKRQVLAGEAALASVMRTAIRDIEVQTRLNCLAMADQMGSESLAYLFDLGLMDTQVKIRESASAMMQQMARRLAGEHPLLRGPGQAQMPARYVAGEGGSDPTQRMALRRQQLAEAILSGMLRYDTHLRPEVVEACMWFEPYLGERFWEILRQPRSRLTRLVGDLLHSSHEPPSAYFLVQAMASQELRPVAVKAITERRDVAWFTGVLRGVEIWQACPKIRKSWGFIKAIHCLDAVDAKVWPVLGRSAALPILIYASNLPQERKGEVLANLWRMGAPDCRQQVLMEAGRDVEWGLPLLRATLSESPDAQEVRMSAYQLRQMNYEGLAGELARRLSLPNDPAATELAGLAAEEIFWRLWTRFDQIKEERRAVAMGVLKRFADQLRPRLRVHLASVSSSVRVRSVRMVGMLGLVDELWRDVLAVAQDQNSRPRAAAVRLLGRSNRPEMMERLRAALDDPDGRVQANAVEAIDEAGWPDRLALIVPKLHSENNRVRANAARALARAGDEKASEVLTAMLQDGRMEYRMTAIWTINAIGAGLWIRRLKELAAGDSSSAVRRFAQAVCRSVSEPVIPPGKEEHSVQTLPVKQPADVAPMVEPPADAAPMVGPAGVKPSRDRAVVPPFQVDSKSKSAARGAVAGAEE